MHPRWKIYGETFFSDKNRCLATMARRAALESALSGVRFSYPAVPQLREFQVTVHSSLEGGKIENKLTGAGINAKNCKNTSPVTTKNFKIGQRGNPELWPILSFFTYFMVGWVGVPT